MLEDIRLKDFPQSSGVYKIIWNGSVVYVGSSNNLYQRMNQHKVYIKKGFANVYRNGKKGFYLFIQNNPFTIEFELTDNYKKMEQELIEHFEPIYNEIVAYTGLTEKEYSKQWDEAHIEERNQYFKQYCENHKNERDQYLNQKCKYNGELITLNTLAVRFFRQGIPHPTLEAKKYLIG